MVLLKRGKTNEKEPRLACTKKKHACSVFYIIPLTF